MMQINGHHVNCNCRSCVSPMAMPKAETKTLKPTLSAKDIAALQAAWAGVKVTVKVDDPKWVEAITIPNLFNNLVGTTLDNKPVIFDDYHRFGSASLFGLGERPKARDTKAILRAALTQLLELTEVPDFICSCHIRPPCENCVEWGGLRNAIADAKSALKAC